MARKKKNPLAKYLPQWATVMRKKSITPYNPKKIADRDHDKTVYTVFNYDQAGVQEEHVLDERMSSEYRASDKMTWINVDGLKKVEIDSISKEFDIHPLLVEDILSKDQRAKLDEFGEVIFTVLPMLYFNQESMSVESEQVSLVLGKNFLLSFQEEPGRDVFEPVRNKIRQKNIRILNGKSDFLCYVLIDQIVDSYFDIIDRYSKLLESLEEDLIQFRDNKDVLVRLSLLRREIMLMKRYLQPVRDMINGLIRNDSPLLEEHSKKFFKDVLDHIIQANDYIENQREMVMNLQELYMNQVNLKMNEVMKIFTIITVSLAPATVIGGIFGMNFEVIPMADQEKGFYFLVALMFIIPFFMLIWFKRKGWY